MSSRDITRTEGNTFPSTQKVENEPSKFKTLGFAVLIIFGVGGLVVAGIGTGGLLQAGSLTNLGQVNSIIMIVVGGAGGIPLLVIGIVGFINTRSGSSSRISDRTAIQDTKHSTLDESEDTEHKQEKIEKADEERRTRERERKNRAEIEKKAREEEAALKQKEKLEAKKVEEEKKARKLEATRLLEEQERLKKAEEEKKANEVPQSPQEFLPWLQKDTKRLGVKEHTERLVAIIKSEEVGEEEIRIFYAGLDESIVLQILNFTQTSNSFNAIDEKIIEKALIVETNFIQAINKKCPHRNLILREKIEKRLLGPSIFRHSMQEEEIVQIGTEFFNSLKSSGQLLTSEQFASYSKEAYRNKGCDLGRILGAEYIKRIAEELGLKHIKVPKKIAVVDESVTELKASVCQSSLELSCKKITIYAEEITPLSRGTTREEVTEFLRILEATGFGDFLGLNFFLGRNQAGEEGIYFIDTEYMNFRHMPFLENGVAEGIARVVQKKDFDWINEKEQPEADGFPSYRHRNQQRVNRYRKLYGIKNSGLGDLMKTYVPESERREKGVKFTYALGN